MEPRAEALRFVDFLNSAVTPFHAVATAKRTLLESGFTELHESQSWNLSPGSKYFFTRNESSLCAFVIGSDFSPLEGSFRIIGTHTDSPCPKLAPVSRNDSQGFLKLNVQLYGGGLWNSWFDRDLTLAGRVIIKQNNQIESRLVHIKRPLVVLPELAIHLSSNREEFKFDKESHFKPLLSTLLLEKENFPDGSKRHSQTLLKIIATELNINEKDIVNLELNVIDATASQLTGIYEEFISSGRIDNLGSTYSALTAISSSDTSGKDIKVFCAFDNEECGSQSIQGADCVSVDNTLRRILTVLPGEKPSDFIEAFYRRSFHLSADMAHALHPNFAEKHQASHTPTMHGGVVIKMNANQRYATDVLGASLLKDLGERNNIKIQDFIVRNDSPCGTTIGPIIASLTGIRTVDIGAPMLSMHSIREMMGTDDMVYYVALMKAFYQDSQNFSEGAALR